MRFYKWIRCRYLLASVLAVEWTDATYVRNNPSTRMHIFLLSHHAVSKHVRRWRRSSCQEPYISVNVKCVPYISIFPLHLSRVGPDYTTMRVAPWCGRSNIKSLHVKQASEQFSIREPNFERTRSVRISHIYTHTKQKNHEPPAGLEPAIPGLGGRCLIHWATEATALVVDFT